MYVIKRNGRLVDFNPVKIEEAIYKGMRSVEVYRNLKDEELRGQSRFIARKVVKEVKGLDLEEVGIEQVQDIVIDVLVGSGEKEVVKSYISYRDKKNQLRVVKDMTDSNQIIENYFALNDWRIKENSNMGYSLQGLNNQIVSRASRNFWLSKVYPADIRKAHESGDMHIHDLDLISSYCCGWDLEDLLLKGFGGAPNKIESKPPKHFRTALGQLVNFFYTLQGESAGAQAVSSFDTYLAPFVREDGLDYGQVKQALQEFIFNCNIPTRVGFQSPFLNLTFDIKPHGLVKNEPIIIGGERIEGKYFRDYQVEMDMINRAFCEVMTEGDAKGRIFTFPIPTYNITKDTEWDAPVMDYIVDMTMKYGTPYFANFVNSDMSPDDVRSMCCRLRLDNCELRKRGGGLFGANPLTGSIGVVTINLPRLGYRYKGDLDGLKTDLSYLMGLAKTSMELKRVILERNTKLGLYPYSAHYLSGVFERFGEYWKNHFNTIGLNGMNECILNFTDGIEDITTEFGQEMAAELLDFMNDLVVSYQVESDMLYNLEATPAEGTAYRLAKLDVERYPDIITAGDDEPYYTNSTQLPVGFTEDLFEAIELQNNLQTKYTGGTVLHGFLGERLLDRATCKMIVKTVFENFEIPYFTLSPTFSVCPDHGYLDGEQFVCPTCGKDCEVWTRVVGFHRPVQNWNVGKREEYKDRKEFVASVPKVEDVVLDEVVNL